MNLQDSGKRIGRWCSLIFVAALLLASWLRFEQLGVKPLHHDESVNGWFMLSLSHEGQYRYNPDNYHGPSLYYLTLAPLGLLGESEAALRSVPAIFGLLGIGLLWLVRHRLGAVGTPSSALLMATSTGLVYYSRDFIHEMIFGCLSLGIVVGAVRYYDERRFRWIVLWAVSLGLLFATKETAIVTTVVLLLALISAWLWDMIRQRESYRNRSAPTGAHGPGLDHIVAALIIFLFINLLLYSSFFTNGAGIGDALRSPWRWTLRSDSEHVKGFWYYGALLLKLELPLLIAAIVGGVIIAWQGSRFWLFVGAWALGLFLAYSIIGYKTPWLIVNMLIPMSLLGGHAIQCLIGRLVSPLARVLAILPLLAGLSYATWFTRELNLVHHDDNLNRVGYLANVGRHYQLYPFINDVVGYVYAQTDRDFLNLVKLIESEEAPVGEKRTIFVAAPEYWPLPWYLRRDEVDFTGKLPDLDDKGSPRLGHQMIIANSDQIHYFSEAKGFKISPTSYSMRPGVSLILLVRKPDHIEESEIRQ
jgi:uncharacterized protein (TIGR03663 family)